VLDEQQVVFSRLFTQGGQRVTHGVTDLHCGPLVKALAARGILREELSKH
jgi:hypothetical protein